MHMGHRHPHPPSSPCPCPCPCPRKEPTTLPRARRALCLLRRSFCAAYPPTPSCTTRGTPRPLHAPRWTCSCGTWRRRWRAYRTEWWSRRQTLSPLRRLVLVVVLVLVLVLVLPRPVRLVPLPPSPVQKQLLKSPPRSLWLRWVAVSRWSHRRGLSTRQGREGRGRSWERGSVEVATAVAVAVVLVVVVVLGGDRSWQSSARVLQEGLTTTSGACTAEIRGLRPMVRVWEGG